MSNIDVSLDVRNFPSTGSDGYTNTTASNNAIYSYLYGGGTDGHGNTEDDGAGPITITVTLHSDPRYAISNVAISGDIQNQLSWQPGASPTSVVISDTDSQTGDGYYSVTVSDNTASCTFPCDPDIKNRPKPP